jgi:quercetin dioxygenase-like cupin family protein
MGEDKVTVFHTEDREWVDIAKGIKRRTLSLGQNMVLNMYMNEKGSVIPQHNHPQELMAVLLEGEVEVTFNEKKYQLKPGMGYHIPPGVMHGPFVTTSERAAIYLDILSPPREQEEYAKK